MCAIGFHPISLLKRERGLGFSSVGSMANMNWYRTLSYNPSTAHSRCWNVPAVPAPGKLRQVCCDGRRYQKGKKEERAAM